MSGACMHACMDGPEEEGGKGGCEGFTGREGGRLEREISASRLARQDEQRECKASILSLGSFRAVNKEGREGRRERMPFKRKPLDAGSYIALLDTRYWG